MSAVLSFSLRSWGRLRRGAEATPIRGEVQWRGRGARCFWKNMEKRWSKKGWCSFFLKPLTLERDGGKRFGNLRSIMENVNYKITRMWTWRGRGMGSGHGGRGMGSGRG